MKKLLAVLGLVFGLASPALATGCTSSYNQSVVLGNINTSIVANTTGAITANVLNPILAQILCAYPSYQNNIFIQTAIPLLATSQIYGGTGTAGSMQAINAGTHFSVSGGVLASDATGTGVLATKGDITAATSGLLPSATTSQLYGGTGVAGAATPVTVGSGLSLTSHTLSAVFTSVGLGVVPGGRLTLTSGVPVMPGTVASAATLYYAPYKSAYVPLFNGTSMALYQFTSSDVDTVGLSLATFGSGWAANTVYDVFVTLNGGVPVLCTGPAWASNGSPSGTFGTAGVRAATGGLAQIFGTQSNASAGMVCRISNSATITVPQYQATWVGTILTDGATQLDFIYGSTGTGGSASYFYVWNAYNRVHIGSINFDTGPTYTYTSATCRLARGSAGNQMFFVAGNTDDGITIWTQTFSTSGTVGAYGFTGSGTNTTVTNNTCFIATSVAASQSTSAVFLATSSYYTGRGYNIGANVIQRMEYGDGTHAMTMDAFAQDTLNIGLQM